MKSILTYFFILIAALAIAQKNYNQQEEKSHSTLQVRGRVTDAKSKQPVAGANVVLKGTTKGATTDPDGYFIIENIPKGEVTITISYVSYKSYEKTIIVTKDQLPEMNIELEENITMMKAFNVVGNKVTNTEVSMMQTLKQSQIIVNGIPAQMIKKTQDRDAGEVVKRIPGITLQDGRFVIIRGLSERYNSVWLNNLPAPSSEADVRAFSFDFIPSAMIENILVYKTFSPELPGDFAGGLIQISTLNAPEKKYLTISYSNSFAEGTTFSSHSIYPINNSTALWQNNSNLGLPSTFPGNISTIPSTSEGKDLKTYWGQTMNKIWTPQTITAPTDQRLSVAGAFRTKTAMGELINTSMVNYSTTFNHDNIMRASYNTFDEVAQRPDTSYCFNDSQSNSSVKLGAMSNWTLVKGRHKFEFRNLLNNISTNRVTEREGKDFYGGTALKGLEMSAGNRFLYTGQISGTHCLSDDTKIKWFGGYSFTAQNTPDNKRLTWVRNDQYDSEYYGQYGLNFSFTANPGLSGRIFQHMNENIINAGSDFNSKFKVHETTIEYKAGFFAENRSRTFSARNLGYKIARTSMFDWSLPYLPVDEVFSNANINTTTGIMLDENTNASDSYDSKSTLIAGYGALTIPVGARLKIYGGLRAENSKVELNSFRTDASNPPKESDAVHYKTDTLLILPAVNATLNLSETNLLRFAYGMTVNRPEYREIAPMAFYDFEMKAVISGNDTLTFARINNFDIRYECYLNNYSMFSFGGFYKHFRNAIEYKVIPTGSGLQYTFQNTPKAEVAGLEAEFRLTTSGMKNQTMFTRAMRNFVIVFNGAYMVSRIGFGAKSLEEQRALQGQSPYVLNASLFYQSDSLGFNLGLMYNVVGKRISFVGDPYTGNPHVYEMPSQQLDFSAGKSIGKKIELKANIKNILNQAVEYRQQLKTSAGNINQTTMKYIPGRYYTLGIVWKF